MRLLRDFLCTRCGLTTEKYIDADIRTIECDCGHFSERVIGMPTVHLDGTDPGFPTAYAKWANVREQNRRVKTQRSYHEEYQ